MKVFKALLLILVAWMSFLTEAAATKIPNPYKVLGVPKDANDDAIK
jgi:preprotein translocase subunit Sec63